MFKPASKHKKNSTNVIKIQTLLKSNLKIKHTFIWAPLPNYAAQRLDFTFILIGKYLLWRTECVRHKMARRFVSSTLVFILRGICRFLSPGDNTKSRLVRSGRRQNFYCVENVPFPPVHSCDTFLQLVATTGQTIQENAEQK